MKADFTGMMAAPRQRWMAFLILALAMQQINLLTYRFGAHHAVPYVFMTYSFIAQSIASLVMMFLFKNRGFPVSNFSRSMWLLLLFMVFVYMANELTLVYVYSLGAPYALMVAIFAVAMLVIMVTIGLTFLKEKIEPRKMIGIVLAIVAIFLIRLG